MVRFMVSAREAGISSVLCLKSCEGVGALSLGGQMLMVHSTLSSLERSSRVSLAYFVVV